MPDESAFDFDLPGPAGEGQASFTDLHFFGFASGRPETTSGRPETEAEEPPLAAAAPP